MIDYEKYLSLKEEELIRIQKNTIPFLRAQARRDLTLLEIKEEGERARARAEGKYYESKYIDDILKIKDNIIDLEIRQNEIGPPSFRHKNYFPKF